MPRGALLTLPNAVARQPRSFRARLKRHTFDHRDKPVFGFPFTLAPQLGRETRNRMSKRREILTYTYDI
ncbi:hypothetical protein D9611_014911 [Ephemerocybe angulata]|uniref:Uncharacterized protein n=1 Tax=Ephemerocybe angulata TaxID=980116 RepID=A0A8H5AQ87_9AGAR|nr:hypothetical protein D9611_014911 [Tulosesus angulatus]